MPKNQYRGGDCLKRGAWTVCRFKGGFGKKEGGGVFEGGGWLILQCTLCVAWKPDLHSHATDAFQQNWAHEFLYAFPPFCMILWYLKILNMSIKSPIFLPWRNDLLKNSKKGNSSPSSEQDSTTRGVGGFWARLQEEEISKAASVCISRSRRPNPNANFESAWRKWASCCSRRNTDSFSSNINEILDYLTDLYKQGLQYRTINNHRSAISAFHEQIQGKPVGEHPRVCALLAGIFNSRPPQPKYCFISNVQTVIEFIR